MQTSPKYEIWDFVMMTTLRIAALLFTLSWVPFFAGPSAAQQAPKLSNPNIDLAYLPPKSPIYLPMVDRLKSVGILEQLVEFLSPLRLPHKLVLVTMECGEANAFYSSSTRSIRLCYEYVAAAERMAPKQDERSEFNFEDVLVGSLVGTMLHEGGHAVFDMLDVPVFGREEDAADAMATFLALQFNRQVAEVLIRGLAYKYKVWFGFGSPIFADEHGTGLQRYYNALCIAYGGSKSQFQDLISSSDFPRERLANCEDEYQVVKAAFERTIMPFVNRGMMEAVQNRPWLQLTPRQASLLRQQQLKTSTFMFSACNIGPHKDVSIALISREDDSQQWRARGWFRIPDGGCNSIATKYQGDKIYYAAQSSDKTVWVGAEGDRTASKQCVEPVKPFLLNAGIRCQPGQVLINFQRVLIDPSSSGYTLLLRGD
jgi:uncharacterized membrane protein